MLNELAAYDSDSALQRRLRHYCAPDALVIDEVGYLSYGNRHADLLFEIINRRYEQKSTMITTNRPFSEWGEVFPGADWTLEQATAVFEFIDDVREAIIIRYPLQIMEQQRSERCTESLNQSTVLMRRIFHSSVQTLLGSKKEGRLF